MTATMRTTGKYGTAKQPFGVRIKIPVVPALGNHDLHGDQKVALENYLARFPALRGCRYYSVLAANALMLVLDSSLDELSGAQGEWVKQKLDTVPRHVDFIIVVLHHQPYTSSSDAKKYGGGHSARSPEQMLAKMLENRQQNLHARIVVFAGHVHITSQLLGRGLDGLVNAAGVGMVRPVEYVPAGDLQEIFNINVFGQIAVTQAFLPLLRKAHGRIVNISSVGAHIAIPFGSLINASKSAFGTFSDTLRLELHPFGLRVCVVEPGAIKTPAVEKTLGNVEAVVRNLPTSGAAQYGEMLKRFARRAYAREMNGSPPEVVAQAVHHALTARRPRTRYRVGKHASLLATLSTVLPDRLRDAILFRIVGLPNKFGTVVSIDDRQSQKRAA
jgi:NAD(P)-dependent dehydrogenase (short-subunit alcohol dehydrogenase family)